MMKIGEKVRKRRYHPLQGLGAALLATAAFLLVLSLLTVLVNFVAS